jgi:hypothetical protein
MSRMASPGQQTEPPSPHRAESILWVDEPEGPVSAAIIAAGIGALVLGIFTTLPEASESITSWFELSSAVGPAVGQVDICGWSVARTWIILHSLLKNRPYETVRALSISLVLIALGVIVTFPTFFQLFAPQ